MITRTQVHTVYRLANGTRVPSVTTVLGVLAKPALIHWAWECGCQGEDYRKVRGAAAQVGTIAHYLIMCHLKGIEPELGEYAPEDVSLAENCVLSYFEWEKGHSMEPVLVEQPLVHEQMEYGGTIDCLAMLDGSLTLIDFKTGKAIYREMVYQLAAYMRLLEENGYKPEAARILRIGRTEDENFEDRLIGVTEQVAGWRVFTLAREIYGVEKRISV